MKNGVFDYADIYDEAVRGVYNGTLEEVSLKYPSVVADESNARIPSHIFSELSKAETGAKLLIHHLPELMDMLNSDRKKTSERRSSHWATSVHLPSGWHSAQICASLIACLIL